jgi:ABC-type phosphate transport system substrate-binding protein
MKSFLARRILPACVISAAGVAALVAPGAASASLGEQCSGSNTKGAGSSLQQVVEGVWTVDFNGVKDKSLFACNGKHGSGAKPTITYESIGSGAGMAKWKTNKEFGVYGFVGTDNTANATEIAEVQANSTLNGGGGKLMTIPTAQSALSIVMHLPTGCTSATSTVAPGRLALNDVTLEGIYRGTITKWSQLEGAENGGNALTCEAPGDNEAAIIPVARLDKSGTTHIFKKFLGEVNTAKFEDEAGESKTWYEVSEGGAINLQWPKKANVVKAKTETNLGMLKEVEETPGSVGYPNVADARNNAKFVPPAGGANTATFWAELESSQKTSKGKVTRTFKDPSSNGDVATKASSNCKSTEYSNGTAVFPPPKLTDPWNEVTAKLASKTYALCGLTYDFALTNYETFAGGTNEEATTVANYLNYVLDAKGGQSDLKNNDYLGLPTSLLTEAKEGPAAIEG